MRLQGSLKTASQESKDGPTTIREGISVDESFEQSFKQLSNLSGLKIAQNESLGMIEERQEHIIEEESMRVARTVPDYDREGEVDESDEENQTIEEIQAPSHNSSRLL